MSANAQCESKVSIDTASKYSLDKVKSIQDRYFYVMYTYVDKKTDKVLSGIVGYTSHVKDPTSTLLTSQIWCNLGGAGVAKDIVVVDAIRLCKSDYEKIFNN